MDFLAEIEDLINSHFILFLFIFVSMFDEVVVSGELTEVGFPVNDGFKQRAKETLAGIPKNVKE